MSRFNAEKYWSSRESKVWVVILSKLVRKNGTRKEVNDRKIVHARTEAGALKTARFHTCLSGKVSAYARLAEPSDLDAVTI